MDHSNEISLFFHVVMFSGAAMSVGIWAKVVFVDSINVKAFGQQVVKLMVAGNASRALKLCNAIPKVLASTTEKAMLEKAIDLENNPNLAMAAGSPGGTSGYRSATHSNKAELLSSAFQTVASEGLKKFNVAVGIAVVGAVIVGLALAAQAFVIGGVPPHWTLGVGAVVLTLTAITAKKRFALSADLQQLHDDMLNVFMGNDAGAPPDSPSGGSWNWNG